MRRLAIFFFYDEHGLVRDYVLYYLQELKKVTSSIYVIVNGELEPDSEARMRRFVDHIQLRENTGFDVGAYKEALESLGRDYLSGFDELLFNNHTCYGPIYPFSEVFGEMDGRDCDFWGITKHPEQPNYLLPNSEGYIFEHITTNFLLLRKRLFGSDDFWDFWEGLPEIHSKRESTGYFETQLTKHFEDLGYDSDSFVDIDEFAGRVNNLTIATPYELLVRCRCPLVKRRSFAFPEANYSDVLAWSAVVQPRETLEHIAKHTEYDLNLIWDDLLASYPLSDIKNMLKLNWVIPDEIASTHVTHKAAGIAVLVESETGFDIVWEYLEPLIGLHRILLIFTDAVVMDACTDMLGDKEDGLHGIVLLQTDEDLNYECLKILRERFCDVDHICALLGLRASENRLGLPDEEYLRYMTANLMGSPGYIARIQKCLEDESRAGLAVPVKANFSDYFSNSVKERALEAEPIQAAHEALEIAVPLDNGDYYANDCAFWIKREALDALTAYLEQGRRPLFLAKSGAFRYLYPSIVQCCGYYTSSVISAHSAETALANASYMQNSAADMLVRTKGFMHNSFHSGLYYARNWFGRQTPSMSRSAVLEGPVGIREIFSIIRKYPMNKRKWMQQQAERPLRDRPGTKKYAASHAQYSLQHILVGGDKALFVFMGPINNKDIYLKVNERQYFPLVNLDEEQRAYVESISAYEVGALFYLVPLSLLDGAECVLWEANLSHSMPFKWGLTMSYSALQLRQHGLYCRISDGRLFVQGKGAFCRAALLSWGYSLKEKILFLFMLINPLHHITVFAENGGAADNAYQLFKTAAKDNKNVRLICSATIKSSEPDHSLRKKMVAHNTRRHSFTMLFSRDWVTSYTLMLECWPTIGVLKDIHYALIPAKWTLVPHGLIDGTRVVNLLNSYSWGFPSYIYTNSPLERQFFADHFLGSCVRHLGSPRMDKWHGAELNTDELLVFFTWRESWRKGILLKNGRQVRQFTCSDYFLCAIDIVQKIRERYPAAQISYVFHHDVIRNGYDEAIREALCPLGIDFISLDTAQGRDLFDARFREAKYLVTDYSSVAYDFASKDGALSLYYLPDGFTSGHYDLLPSFFSTQLGCVARTSDELLDALALSEPVAEMHQRRDAYFAQMNDGKSAQRVLDAILDGKFESPSSKTSPICIGKGASARRLGIFLFYDPEGIVDEYVVYYLQALKPFCDELCVVVNGHVTEASLQKLKNSCDTVVLRENYGWDSWGYKAAVTHYGYERIACDYDELLISNYTCYGPVYPLSEMFDEMNGRDCDFWGHSRYVGRTSKIAGVRVDDHVQSYFVVLRKTILQSQHFVDYWESLNLPLSYVQAIAFHELRLTRYFESRGFISSSYMSQKDFPSNSENATIHRAYSQVVHSRSPFVKRKIFTIKDDKYEFPLNENHSAVDLLDFIKKETGYDTNLIVENVLRTNEMPEEETEMQRLTLSEKLKRRFQWLVKKRDRWKFNADINKRFSYDELLKYSRKS